MEKRLIDFELKENQQKLISVIGSGLMGISIAEYLLRKNYLVILKTRYSNKKEDIISRIYKKISKDYNKEQTENYIKNLNITTEYQDLSNSYIIIEAVIEDIAIKKEIFRKLNEVCDTETIFTTNTSSLSIDDIASVTTHQDKVIGMHFFNPVSKMDLIEVVLGKYTSESTKNTIISFTRNINKKPIVLKNSPGFIVNRLLLPQINEAVYLLEEGVATKEDIDNAIKMGLNHPMGPFSLADFIGLDVCAAILETLYNNFHNEKYRPAKTWYYFIKKGKLGRKSGEGFYKYE